MYNEAIEMVVERYKNDPNSRIELVSNVTLEFYRYEKENHQVIRDCVEKHGVEVQWVLRNDLLRSHKRAACKGSELSFLSSKQDCRHDWISQQHRSQFYQECLEKFDMKELRKRSTFGIRRLENLANIFKTNMLDKAAHQIGGGSTLIAAGILGGAGVLLPATGPVGLILVGISAVLGAAGSIATFFGKDSTSTISEAKGQIILLKQQHDAISNLLVLYGKANSERFDEIEHKDFEARSQEVMDRIQENYLSIVTAGSNVIKSKKNLFNSF